ncbi:hypothetical protein ACFVHB_20195 [Kitasatospora sp. NPDC127111]|uniref:hypothetical protein n=1 Tax=Kitasatospora sp. NPDC127111 TaxID=3345363 RepID=UPI00363E951C
MATRTIIATKRVRLTGPMETEADLRYLDWMAARLGVTVADRDAAWLWTGTEALIVIAGWEDSSDARCDVTVAEAGGLIVHRLTDHRGSTAHARGA